MTLPEFPPPEHAEPEEGTAMPVISTPSESHSIPMTTPSPQSGSLLIRDTTGLSHTKDYSVCKNDHVPPINLTPLGAKVVEAFHSWLKQGLTSVRIRPLLQEMERLSKGEPKLCSEIHNHYYGRADYLFRKTNLWHTLVGPSSRRGEYRLIL
jgi:hypothetical protein